MSDREQEPMRLAVSGPIERVDQGKRVIYGVNIGQIGEAFGHEVFADSVFIDQIVSGGKGLSIGAKCRFDHPNACSKSLGKFIGRVRNFRRDNDRARGDLFVDESAFISPEGNLGEYVLTLAESDPDAFGMSIVFDPDKPEMPDKSRMGEPGTPPEDDPFWLPHVRMAKDRNGRFKLSHCDVVDAGAITRGIFGRPDYMGEQIEKWAKEHPKTLGRMFEWYQDYKANKEEEQMSGEVNRETEKKLAEATGQIGDLTVKLSDATSKITELTADKEKAGPEAEKALFARIKARREKYDNPGFILETIELSDGDFADACIAKLQTGDDTGKDGEQPAPFSEGGTDPAKGADNAKETFEQKRDALKEAHGLSFQAATARAIDEHPEEYAAYQKRTNKERGRTL